MNSFRDLLKILAGLFLAVSLLIVLIFAASLARAEDEKCSIVEEKSVLNIECTKSGNLTQLTYKSKSAFYMVKFSGQHKDMLKFLCEEADTIVEIVAGKTKYRITDCYQLTK